MEPTLELYESFRGKLSYRGYLEIWGNAILDLVSLYTEDVMKAKIDELEFGAKHEESVHFPVNIPIPRISYHEYLTEKERRVSGSYSYLDYLNDWRYLALNNASKFVEEKKKRLLEEEERVKK